jgi:glycosyltransferase involved in cell wall biosynthesis
MNEGIKNIVYVGAIVYDKGISDLIEAVILLLKQGKAVTLTVVGDGADVKSMQDLARAHIDNDILFLGRISNDKVFDIMLASDLICVPSRHKFTEGMPLTLTEALASRTPVIISDHPVFKRAFIDEEGVCFFTEKDSIMLAKTINNIFIDADKYKTLSMLTKNAFGRVECQTTFGDVITQWQETFE